MSLGFCSRCWNYVDFCDCVNFNYDCEDDYDSSIPAQEDPAPEVGTVWYFLVPIKDLSLYFESNGVEKVGLSLLLMQESLWTIAPPPGDESLYLSVPVDRLPERDRGLVNGTQYKYLNPWEFNYFNYNGPPIDKIVSLAAEIQECNKKKLPAAKKACKMIKLLKNFFQGFKVEDIPIPPGLEEAVLKLTGALTPEQMLLLLTTLLPIELLQELNKNAVTAIDYDWVHRHLVNTLDPDSGYEDKTQDWIDCFAENDLFCQHGSYPFPLPSDSVDMGDPVERSDQKTKPACGEWCQYLKRPVFTTTGKPGDSNYTKRPAKFTSDKKPVPQWVRDLIQAALDRGESGNISNPPNGPVDMEIDDPQGDTLEPARNVLRERGGTYTLVSADTGPNAGKYFVAKFHKGVKLPQNVYDQIVKARADLGYTGGEQFPPEIMNGWKPRDFQSRSAQRSVKPVFDDILLYDDDDDEYLNIRVGIDQPRTSLPYGYNLAIPPNYPTLYNILQQPGSNQTSRDTACCIQHELLSNGDVLTYVRTGLSNFTAGNVVLSIQAVFVTPVHANNRPIMVFKWLSGNKTLTIRQGSNNNTQVANGSDEILYITEGFSSTPEGRLAYDDVQIVGNGVDSLWRCTWQVGVPGLNRFRAQLVPISNVVFTPTPPTPTSFTPGTRYTSSLTFRSNPLFQFPVGIFINNSLNMLSQTPNSFVTPGSIGYVNSLPTGLGGIYLPYRLDTVGTGSIVSNQIIFETNGTSDILGLVSYPV